MAEKFKIVKDLKTEKKYLAKPHFISKDEHAYFSEYKEGAIPKIGTKELNDLASAYFGGKPKQQTAREYLIKRLENLNLIKDGDLENELFRQIELEAKELEKQQEGYNEEEILNIIYNFCETFKVDSILRNEFDKWFEQFKKK